MKALQTTGAIILLVLGISSCTEKESPEPPKKKPTKEMIQWNDWIDPNRNPPHVDTTIIKP